MSESLLRAENPPALRAHDGERQPTRCLSRQELERHHEASWGWALHCCSYRKSVAEDVLQASYLKILQGKAAFAGRSSTQTFLFGVIRRTALEAQRAQGRRESWLDRFRKRPQRTTPVATPEQRFLSRQEQGQLRKLLSRLSERQQAVLQLVFYHDLTVDDVASILSISVGSARQHYHRGKARLRSLLSNEETTHV